MKVIKIGRSSDNDIIINDQSVSREHALFIIDENGKIIIRDLSSVNGTFINEAKIIEETLKVSDTIRFGNYRFNDWPSQILQTRSCFSSEQPKEADIFKHISIGRSASNDVVLDFDDVSSYHAELLVTYSGMVFIKDKRSTNGTKVNGNCVEMKELQKGDIVVLSDNHKLDWERAVNPESTKIILPKLDLNPEQKSNPEQTLDPVPKRPPRKLKVLPLIIVLVFASIAVVGWMFRDLLMPQNMMDRYKKSIVLVYHEYVFEIDLGERGKADFTITENGAVEIYNPEKNLPIAFTGTGFFVSTDGKIITNRQVSMPWEYGDQKKMVKNFVQKLVDGQVGQLEKEKFNNLFISLFNQGRAELRPDLDERIRRVKELDPNKLEGKTVFLGAGMPDDHISKKDIFLECTGLDDVQDKNVDVALIQLNSKKLPEMVTNYVNLDEAIVEKSSYKPGMKLFMISYPIDFKLGYTTDALKLIFEDGLLSREPDNIQFGHNLQSYPVSSGSPMFNESGRLVGINTSRVTDQKLNYGIVASYAVNLYNKNK